MSEYKFKGLKLLITAIVLACVFVVVSFVITSPSAAINKQESSAADGVVLNMSLYQVTESFTLSLIKSKLPKDQVTIMGNIGYLNLQNNKEISLFDNFSNQIDSLTTISLIRHLAAYTQWNKSTPFITTTFIPYIDHIQKQKDGDMAITPKLVQVGSWINIIPTIRLTNYDITLALSLVSKAVNNQASAHLSDLQIGKPNISESNISSEFTVKNGQIAFIQMQSAQAGQKLLLVIQPEMVKKI